MLMISFCSIRTANSLSRLDSQQLKTSITAKNTAVYEEILSAIAIDDDDEQTHAAMPNSACSIFFFGGGFVEIFLKRIVVEP